MEPTFAALLNDASDPLDVSTYACWILDDGRLGHVNQCKGVAQALGIREPKLIPLERTGLLGRWSHLSHHVLRWVAPERAWRIPPGPYPQLVFAAGTQGAQVSRVLKQRNPSTFTVQLMSPPGRVEDYDVVAMPLHDEPPARANVVTTIGSPNTVTIARLQQEADRWETRLLECPSPRLAVLIGGDTAGFRFHETAARAFVDAVLNFARQHRYSLLVTASRRTDAALVEKLRQWFADARLPHYFWTSHDPLRRDNPYLAYLALAEAVVVTADSVSMVSEACTAGKPVYLWGQERMQRKKFQLYYDILARQRRVAPFPPHKPLRAPDYPLADTEHVAAFIRSMLARRHQGATGGGGAA